MEFILKDRTNKRHRIVYIQTIRQALLFTLFSLFFLSFNGTSVFAQTSHDNVTSHSHSSSLRSGLDQKENLTCAEVCKLAATNHTQLSSVLEVINRRIKHPKLNNTPPLIHLLPVEPKIKTVSFHSVSHKLYISGCCLLI